MEAARSAERLFSSAGSTDQSSQVLGQAVTVIRRVMEENRNRSASLRDSVGRLQAEANNVRKHLSVFTRD